MKKTLKETIQSIKGMINNIDHPDIISEQKKYLTDSFELRDFLKTLVANNTYSGMKDGSCVLISDKNTEFCGVIRDRGWHNGAITITRTGPDDNFQLKICKSNDCNSYNTTVTFTESSWGKANPAEEDPGGSVANA